jgi:hypothetical protein
MLDRTNSAIISDARKLHQSRLDNMGPKITNPQLVVNQRDLSTLKDIKAEQNKLAILNKECKRAEAPIGAPIGVHGALCRLRMEAKRTCEGGEGGKGLHGGCWGALQEGIVCISQRLCQPHCCDLLKRPLHSEVK